MTYPVSCIAHTWSSFATAVVHPSGAILLNSVLELNQPIVSVEFLNPFSYKVFEDDKLVCVDVKATLDYESNLIDARQEGREEGLANGEAIGRVKTYQEPLGEKVTSDEELSRMTVDQLVSMIAKLQAGLREPNSVDCNRRESVVKLLTDEFSNGIR